MSTNIKLNNANGTSSQLVIENPDTNFNGRTIDISKVAHQVDTIADLRAMTEKPDTVYVTGYHTAGDGAFGSHFFKRVDSAGTDNTGTIVVPNGVTAYYYALQYEGAVNVKWFGAKGDGVADDTLAIQSAIDTTNIGNSLIFSDSLIYLLSTKLFIHKSITVNFNDSTLLIDNSSYPDNGILDISSLTSTKTTWTETILKNQDIFTVTTTFTRGDYVYIELGVDPYDSNEQHYTKIARVEDATSSTVRLDLMVPYNINGTTHNISKITSLVSNCEFSNLKVDYVSGTVPDVSINANKVFNVLFKNIESIKSRICLNVYDAFNIKIDNIYGNVEQGGVSSHGRILGMWQVDTAEVNNIQVNTNDSNNPFIFIESWCRGMSINNTIVNRSTTGLTSTGGLVFVTGGSYDIKINNFTAHTNYSEQIVSTGGIAGDYTIRGLTISKYPLALSLNAISNINIIDTGYNINLKHTKSVISRIDISLNASLADKKVVIANGIIKNLWLFTDDASALGSIYMLNSNGQGTNINSQILTNTWSLISGTSTLGTNYPFNNPNFSQKSLHIYTSSTATTSNTLKIVAEYYPYVLDNNYSQLFVINNVVSL